MRQLFIHATTIPTRHPGQLAHIHSKVEYQVPDSIGEILPAGNLKDPVKIAESIAHRTAAAEADLQARREKARLGIQADIEKTATDGWKGHVVAISYAWDEEPVQTVTGFPSAYDGRPYEADLMHEFLNEIVPDRKRDFRVVGYAARYEILMIWQRAHATDAHVPLMWEITNDHINSTANHGLFLDVREQAGSTRDYLVHGHRPGPDLRELCESLGIPTEPFMTTSQVCEALRTDKLRWITHDGERYVRRLRRLQRCLVNLPALAVDADNYVAPPPPEPIPPPSREQQEAFLNEAFPEAAS
jgi:hypothetical protein